MYKRSFSKGIDSGRLYPILCPHCEYPNYLYFSYCYWNMYLSLVQSMMHRNTSEARHAFLADEEERRRCHFVSNHMGLHLILTYRDI